MNVSFSSWGSPIGIGIFIFSLGFFFWGMFTGYAALANAKAAELARKGKQEN